MIEHATLEIGLRLLAALTAGALIGLEREIQEKAAGIRTHALVSVGAALFTLAGAYGFPEIHTSTNVDPMRVAAQVASGIGFIGAGAILRDGLAVRGVTTAATLWLSAALGLTAGAGAWGPLLIGCAMVAIALVGLRALKNRFSYRRREAAVVSVTSVEGEQALQALFKALNDTRLGYEQLDLDGATAGSRRVTIRLHVRRRELQVLLAALQAVPSVQHVNAETGE